MITILVADSHCLLRTSLARALDSQEDIEVTGEASRSEDIPLMACELRPDVVLMELRAPNMDGVDILRRMLLYAPRVRPLMLLDAVETALVRRLLKAGATGLINQKTEVNETIRAIRTVSAGQRYISLDLAQQLALSKLGFQENPFDQLTPRERQVALMVINCHKTRNIADRLFVSTKTVNTYRYRIFDKLNVTSDVELTHLGLRHGLVDI
ncbi:UvrY/SirA/GacA family response regulator transcription factor [Halomonas shantousis]